MCTRLQVLAKRSAHSMLSCLLRYWPEGTREWGMALTAETEEITGAWDALYWSVGGVMLFARSLASELFSWMKLPTGTSLAPGGSSNPSFLPKRSRLFTACVFVAAGALLALPQSQQAITTLRASWHGFQPSSSDRRALDKLVDRAEKEDDAALLAFVALSVDDSSRFTVLANRAVALDPQFVWIYAAARSGWRKGHPLSPELLRPLQAADPGNAVPKLLTQDPGRPPFSVFPAAHPEINRVEVLSACCSSWVEQMEQVFAAPHYDSYFQQHFLLTTGIWNREKSLSPSMALSGFWAHRIPDLLSLRTFADFRRQQAKEASTAGNFTEAQRLLNEVDSFGQKMYDGSATRIEKLIGLAISHDANEELSKLYAASGNAAEASRTDLRLEDLKQRVNNLRLALRRPTLETWGIALNVFALLAVLAAIAALAAIVLLEFRSANSKPKVFWSRKILCWSADHAPALLLCSGFAFILSFIPYARAFVEYRSSKDAFAHEQLANALMGLTSVPEYLFSFESAIVLWCSVIVALTALGLFIIGRAVYRRTQAPADRP